MTVSRGKKKINFTDAVFAMPGGLAHQLPTARTVIFSPRGYFFVHFHLQVDSVLDNEIAQLYGEYAVYSKLMKWQPQSHEDFGCVIL
jgi:hypothetical protein